MFKFSTLEAAIILILLITGAINTFYIIGLGIAWLCRHISFT